MGLEGEESQAHVGEDEVLCQEVQQLKQLLVKRQEICQQRAPCANSTSHVLIEAAAIKKTCSPT